ncbi:MAG: hypothetical protein HY063_03235 [Bacteroidetes bacterium]|nr:hypothetical protein [Bacteroidota bacterium]
MKTLKSPQRIIPSSLAFIVDCIGFYQFFFHNSNSQNPMNNIDYTWLIISCVITILLAIFYFYWKISDKIGLVNTNILYKINSENIELKNKIIALKKFRDFESNEEQIFRRKFLSVFIKVITEAKIWKLGTPDELTNITGKQLTKLIEEKVLEYNKYFSEEKEYKREE